MEYQRSLFPDLQPPVKGRDKPPVSRDRLPTNTTTYQHPIHRWFNFIAGFSPEFVDACCKHLTEGVLLDPFAGCATAPLVACQRGLRAIGFEPHPVFARIARAKVTTSHAIDTVDEIETSIQLGLKNPVPRTILPHSPEIFLAKLFANETLEALLGAREALKKSEVASSDLSFLVLSKIVDESSHSQTDGIYKAPTSKKKSVAPAVACTNISKMIRNDLMEVRDWNGSLRATIYEQSSEHLEAIPDDSINIVVTSPPYLNNFDFAEMTRMLLYFWEIAASWGEITEKVRSKLVVNTTTALKGHKVRQREYIENIPPCLRTELRELVNELADRRTAKAGKKEYDYLVYPYFSQMYNVLSECFRCMVPGAEIHIMVADAALYGVHISTPQILRDMLSEIEFHSAQCELVRRRGHRWILDKREGSKKGLGEYHVSATK